MDEFDESSPAAPPPKPSKTPSWIMLGFIAGALFVWALQQGKETPAPATKPAPAVEPVSHPPRLSDVEAVFEEWKRFAVWANDTTYVCMADSATGAYRDCFEVVRRGDTLFFRSVPRPHNLRAIDGVPTNSPLEFLNPVPEMRGLFGERIPQPSVEPPPGLPALEK